MTHRSDSRVGLAGLLVLGLLAGSAHAADQADVSTKLDQGLDDADKSYPVFVRLTDQLFAQGGDYEQFCKDHQKDKRSAVRQLVVQTLRAKSDRSWDKIKARVEKLEAGGDIQSLLRFWIINGFACEATGRPARSWRKTKPSPSSTCSAGRPRSGSSWWGVPRN